MTSGFILGKQTTLFRALETYNFYMTMPNSKQTYLVLKDKNNYSVVKKVSTLTYILQSIGKLFGGSGPTYTSKKTNKNILSEELSHLNRDTSLYHTLSKNAQNGFCLLSSKLKVGEERFNSKKSINCTPDVERENPPLVDFSSTIKKAKIFITENQQIDKPGHTYVNSVYRLINECLSDYRDGEEPTDDQLNAYNLLNRMISIEK